LPEDAIPFDQPAELGYVCPLCQNKPYNKESGCFDERLHWSEYEGFLWCSVCNLDIPTCFCVSNLNKKGKRKGRQWYQKDGLKDAIKIYLDCIECAIERSKEKCQSQA